MTDLLNQMQDDTSVDLLDALTGDNDSTPWKPEAAGDGLQGVVVALSTVTSDYGQGDIPVVEVKNTDGVFSIRGYHSVLRNELAKANPEAGDTLAVKYHGQKTPKDPKGKPYHHYQVRVVKGTGNTGATAAREAKAPF